jgi:glucose-1-phosphate cytidylyltransferase
MKVVIFCGGRGLRLRDDGYNTPKPLARIGTRPVLWHVMSYYAHYGYRDFVLCLGYRAEEIKRYFLEYQEALSNDFVLKRGGHSVDLLNRDIDDWTITFVDTGLHASIGERLRAVQHHVGDEEAFLATYGDGLCDVPLDGYVEDFLGRDRVAAFLSVVPGASFHFVDTDAAGQVIGLRSVHEADVRINGGFFVFRRAIFDYLRPGEDLVDGAFHRLIEDKQLVAYRYDGFWQCLDTFKDRQALEELESHGNAPWMVWRRGRRRGGP